MIITLQTLLFFRESLLTALDRLLRPYYTHFLTFNRHGDVSDDEGSEDQVFAEFHEEKGVVFYPPMYAQRYAAVSDCLMDERWRGKLEKVVDLGFHDMSFIKYLKEVPGVKCILGVDIDNVPLRCSSDLVGGEEYSPKRENPLKVILYQGNAADPDYRLIGCDAVVAIEMIEHMLPHDLERLVHTVFGFIKPWIAVFTTPNSDFNELFKALERNGLRRLDHFFEWSREQFHDWCSNIVARYPQYTVNCQGIGPGPPGTEHHGCCSQLALFIAKDYHKQRDLDLNSLAIVAKNARQPNHFSEIIGNLDDPDCLENNICQTNEVESCTDVLFSDKYSSMTLVLAPSLSIECVEYRDETSQCNLDTEIGRNFLMFEDDLCCDVVVPRRRTKNRVYEIGDVASRLNCSTLQVKKFSKTTQNLMAKNKIDTLVHTREVVDEIRHLTKMLNFRKEAVDKGPEKGNLCNINWGEDAPYWNQYYKIIKEYSYPFETKTEETRILDLISDEINRLIDMQYDEEFSVDVNKLEIPLARLMDVVQHITDDVDRVKDLLEWNGYEVVDDMVIHSRLVMDNVSVSQDHDWPDDAVSDFNTTDIHSTTASEASIVLPDHYGRCLRRALDVKLRKLKSMLSADEDISTELDKVVCRLLKLALRTSRGRQTPPPSRWMQCKLFDLLSLTEKAIERRKRRFIENYSFNGLDYDYQDQKTENFLAIANTKEDDSVNTLVNKYHHLVQSYDIKENKKLANKYSFGFFDQEEDMGNTVNEFIKDFNGNRQNIVTVETTTDSGINYNVLYKEDETKLQRVQAWVDDDVEVVPYPNHHIRDINSGDTDNSISNILHHRFKKSSRKRKAHVADTDKNHLRKNYNYHKIKYVDKTYLSKGKLLKKMPKNKSSYNILTKTHKTKPSSMDYENYKINNKKKYSDKNHGKLQSIVSKPIPESLIGLCSPKKKIKNDIEDIQCSITGVHRHDSPDLVIENEINIAATKESLLIDIVMDGGQETVALRRTIGTNAAKDSSEFEQDSIFNSVVNIMREDSFCNMHEMTTDNVESQTIFLYDINEPSTSKGLRRMSTDVQCGPDVTTNTFPTLSVATSSTKIPKKYTSDITYGESFKNLRTQISTDFGTCTDDCYKDCKTISPRTQSVGIKIKDSDPVICEKVDFSIMTHCHNNITDNILSPETHLIKPITSRLKMEDSCSELYESVGSYRKSPCQIANSSKNTSDIRIKSLVNKEIGVERQYSPTKYIRPKLCRGGVLVHSYKDQQESSDVLFQGQWQKYKPKSLVKKRIIYNSGITKRVYDVSKKNSKEKMQANNLLKYQAKLEQKKATQKLAQIRVRNTTRDKIKEDVAIYKKPLSNSLLKSVKFSRNTPKVTSKLSISAVKYKNVKPISASKTLAATSSVAEKECKLVNEVCKTYIPMYLKRNKVKLVSNQCVTNKSIESPKVAIKVNKHKPPERVAPLQRSKTVDIKNQLLKFPDEPRENINFVVLRNDTNNNKNTTDGELPESTKGNVKKKNSSGRRSYSPQSENSSTGSSPNSIATIRAVKPMMVSTRRHSTSSNKANIDSENRTLLRNKKNTKNPKQNPKPGNKADDRYFDNKENIPESSTHRNTNKESDKIVMASFVGAHKSVYRAQVTTESGIHNVLNSLSRHKSQTPIKASMNITGTDDKTLEARTSISPVLSAPKICSNKTLVLKTEAGSVPKIQHETLMFDSEKDFQNVNDGLHSRIDNNINNSISTDIKHMIEERLAFIDNVSDTSIDSETELLSHLDLQKFCYYESFSPASFKTVVEVTNEDLNTSLRSDIENAMNRTFDSILVDNSAMNVNNLDAITPDIDLLSFKSITTSASRASEYFLADTELNNNEMYTRSESSVRDIFERKDHLQIQNPAGALAVQAFSGFSMNIEPVGGDRLDPVNLIDSETGSMALEMLRQTTSEELFTSVRSSGTYESCFVDEDGMLPYWLFQSSRQSVDEEEPEEILPIPILVPLPEDMYDTNGNVLPEVGAGTGAGDGRGMHSDNSQDSSGRGTTTSSSGSSSGVQSEAILIDPSALGVPFEMIREAVDNSDAPPLSTSIALTDTSYHASDVGQPNGDVSTSRDVRWNPLIPLATSDMDADVSSLDTDVLDSSDN